MLKASFLCCVADERFCVTDVPIVNYPMICERIILTMAMWRLKHKSKLSALTRFAQIPHKNVLLKPKFIILCMKITLLRTWTATVDSHHC